MIRIAGLNTQPVSYGRAVGSLFADLRKRTAAARCRSIQLSWQSFIDGRQPSQALLRKGNSDMVQLGYEALGRGETKILVINDWMADTSTWEPAKPYLDRRRFTWAFADLRGYGRSRDLLGPFNLGQAAADVIALADELGWTSFALVGHSMSTLVAIHLAQHHNDRVTRVALLTPPPPAGFGADDAGLAGVAGMAHLGREHRLEALRQRWGDRLSEGWVAFKTDQWMATARPDAVAAYAKMFAQDGLPDLKTPISVPVLALTGEEDVEIMRSEPVAAFLAPLAPNLASAKFEQCSHYPMQELPPLTVSTLERFFSGQWGARASSC